MIESYPKEVLNEIEKIKEKYKSGLADIYSKYNSMIDKNETELCIYECNAKFNQNSFNEFKQYLKNNNIQYTIRYDPDDDDSMGFHFTRPYYEFTFSKDNYPQKYNN
jgi:uncharacterized protein (DUF2235 family)